MVRVNHNKIHKTTAAILLTAILLSSCGTKTENYSDTGEGFLDNRITAVGAENTESIEIIPAAEYSEFDLNSEIAEDAVMIELNGNTAEFTSEAVELREGKLVISSGGDYVLRGSFKDQIIVNARADDNVHLILDGVSLTAAMAPLYFVCAKNASVTLAEGSLNTIADSTVYTFGEGEDEPNAAVFSKCDLSINGTGSLEVNGLYECGIRSKDDLKIISGNISVQSVGDAVKGKDSLLIRDGNIMIVSSADGLKSNNDEDINRGYVIIEGGNIDVTAGDDGIHSETWLQIYDGNINVHQSYEALEAKKIEIYGGNLNLTASDDGINASSGSSGGAEDFFGQDRGGKAFDWGSIFGSGDSEFAEAPEIPEGMESPQMPEGDMMFGDRDMPADGVMPEMPGNGEIPAMPDNEGIPPAGNDMGEMTEIPQNQDWAGRAQKPNRQDENFKEAGGENGFFGGRGGNGGNKENGGFGGMGRMNEAVEDGVYIRISGGTIRVQSGVDILDSNGTFTQIGGTLITAGTSMTVYGSPDGVIDTNGESSIEGGTFVSLARSGGSGLESFTALPGFLYSTSTDADPYAELTITDESDNTVLSFIPGVSSQTIFITSGLFETGKEYTVRYGERETTYSCTDAVINLK